MRFGLLFPQTEFGSDPQALRDYARAAVAAGFDHVVCYEHVLGAVRDRLPADYAPYTIEDAFHEPFALFSFLAAVAPELGFATGILVLPQRQAPLVAKQAVDVQLKSGGQFRLGVGIGWNKAEFEGLGCQFGNRARRMEEQIEVMRRLWSEDRVDFQGRFHHLDGVGLKPRCHVPVWVGARAEPALKRAAELGDGFFPLLPLQDDWAYTLEHMRRWREAAGKSWDGFGMEARVDGVPGWREAAEVWARRGASHVYLATMNKGLKSAADHIAYLAELGREL